MLKTINTRATAPPSTNMRPQITMSVAFVNRTGRTITVVWRNGQNAVIHPQLNTNASGQFTVLVTYTFSGEVRFNSLPQTFEFDGNERRLFEEALKIGLRTGNSLQVAYQIPFEDLEGCRGVYHDSLDLVITERRNEEVPKHPRSVANVTERFIPNSDTNLINYRIVVVDKRRLFGRRFINLGGEVLEVPIAEDDSTPDGIYIAYSAGEQSSATRYSLDSDSCPVTFWHSHSEAMSHGDMLEEAKREYELKKHDLKVKELEISSEKGRMEVEHKREIQMLEAGQRRVENALSEREREIEHLRKVKESNHKIREADVKHQYEEQSTVRKNTAEWLKLVPPLLGFVGLSVGMYKSK